MLCLFHPNIDFTYFEIFLITSNKLVFCCDNNRSINRPWWLGVERLLHKRCDSAPAVRIPARDYKINCSELEILS